MTPDMVRRALSVLETQFAPYLQGVSWRAIDSARAQVEASFREYERRRRLDPPEDFPWGFAIDRELPIEFINTVVDGHNVRFDLYGRFTWRQSNEPCVERLLVVRVWALDDADMFRIMWDAPRIEEELAQNPGRGRVVMRFHHDAAQADQEGPSSHLQFGGIAGAGELCWLVEDLSVPRLPSAPADIVLAAELIVATIDNVRATIFDDPSVEGVILDSQQAYLAPYFAEVSTKLARGGRLLPQVWSN